MRAVLQQDRHNQLFLIYQVAIKFFGQSLDCFMESRDSVCSFILLRQDGVGLINKSLQIGVQQMVIGVQQLKPLRKPIVFRHKYRKIVVIFDRVVPMQFRNQQGSVLGKV